VKERIRVLILLADLAGGGAERTITRILEGIDRTRFEPRLGLLWKDGPFVSRVDERELLTPPRIPSRNGTPLAALALLAPWVHLKYLRDFRPHVVMSLTASMNLSAGLAVALGGRGCGWILREGNNTWRMIQDDLPHPWAARARKALTGLLYRRADKVLAISQGLADGLVQHFRVAPSKIEVIYNPVDLPEQTEPGREDPSGPPCILAVGRLEYQKGFDLLLEALALMEHQRARLVILGEGSRREELTRQAQQLGLADRVEMPGFCNDPGSYFARARVFALPSRWEGFGCVVVESMAAGLPVVVTGCDYGPPEIVQHEVNGLVVPPQDPAALARALDRVLAERELAHRLAAAGRARADHFRIEAISAQYQDLWEKVAGR